MRTKQLTASHFNRRRLAWMLLAAVCLTVFSSCLSYRFTRRVQGLGVEQPQGLFAVGQTTLGDVLTTLGAPDTIIKIDEQDLLVYERSVFHQNRFSLGIPLMDVALGGSVDVSASGGLTRYDSLAFFFGADGVLAQVAVQEGSASPYLRTLFQD